MTPMPRQPWWTFVTLSLGLVIAWAAPGNGQDDGGFPIRGRVLDDDSKPVAGAMVRLLAPGFIKHNVDEKTTADAEGRFQIAAPKHWTRMDATQRQELALLAAHGERIAVIQFNRSSAPPTAAVELKLPGPSETKITVLAPDNRPVVGAKVKVTGLFADTIRVDLTEAEVKQLGGRAKKTPVGYVTGSWTVGLPPELQVPTSTTDAKGVATLGVAASKIGALTVVSDEFGEQTAALYSYDSRRPADWPQRLVLKKTGRILGQLTGANAQAAAQREVTVSSVQQAGAGSLQSTHASIAKVTTDAAGKFEVPKALAGMVRVVVTFDPKQPSYPEATDKPAQLSAGETLNLKIAMKPAVRVEGRVLDAASKKPIADVQVRAYIGMAFESAVSDVDGKFMFWMPAGDTAFHPDIPDEFLSPIAPSDYFDNAKRQQTLTLFKVPQAERFEAPPILLHRQATLRGTVVDNGGQPLAGAKLSGIAQIIDRRTGTPLSREVVAATDQRGEFTIPGLDPREPLRLRATAKEATKIVTVAKPGSETVRLVIAPGEQFHLAGQVADAEGKPVGGAILELWHRDWRPAPAEADPTKLRFKNPIRADAEGRFKTPPLTPDGHYRFTIRAAGAKTVESAWLDATSPEAAKPQTLVVTRLGGLAGVVRDRAGKPVADAGVFLLAKDLRADTVTSAQGEFRLETPAGKPFCVVVRHPEFRGHGVCYEKNPSDLDQTLVRLTEPDEKLTPRQILSKDERAKLLERVFEPFKQKLAKATNTQEKVMALQSLTGPQPEFVIEFLEKAPLQPAMYNTMLLTQVAMKRTAADPDEAEELIGRLEPGAQKSLSYGKLVDVLPESARARKLAILAEALVAARAEKSPAFRAIALGQVASRLFALGEKDRATALLREGEKIAGGLSTSAFAGFARGCFATDLALIDLPAALGLLKDLKDRMELARHHGNTAHRLARMSPADAVKVLDLIPPPAGNELNQRDSYAIRVCYRMAQVDLPATLKLADSIIDVPSRAYALGVMAQGVGKRDAKQAADLLRRAFALLDEDAARPDPPQLTSALTRGSVAAALVLLAEQIDPGLVRECLWRAVALQRPHTDDPQQMWRYATGNSALAMVAARYDAKLAELLLPAAMANWVGRESLLAEFLTNPQRAVEAAEKKANGKDDHDVLRIIVLLSAEEQQFPRLILNNLGIWRIDAEDIDD